ncbi:LytR/AlgR family response regulator transcription factor [Mucilaginibacter ginkgonis]|uniref:Response regulator transcription factor n=1 Tax=Mucilaginibacter ginkgonis TaxID=2682091 RepID=A0A6I4HZM0_9SPHI|nr:LytTR family DNA-binding domain-containing protein [Mucilaginibacter ginkgonis]QQL49975.1 response regulator transcription factor [Mucilaginibacter ginkgonis]
MSLNCFIVDDEQDAIGIMQEYISRTPGLSLLGSSQNPVEALDLLTGADAPDLTFIDVDMRLLSGLELADMINLYTNVVFTTAFPEYAIQAFEKDAFDYLLKPINYERFLKCVQRVKKRLLRVRPLSKNGEVEYFNIKSEIKGRMVKINVPDVIYIEGAINYVQLYTIEGKHMTYLTMKDIEAYLPPDQFVRVHRSFIVNIAYVKITERNRLILENGTEVIMGNYYKDRFLEIMDQHLIKTNRAS